MNACSCLRKEPEFHFCESEFVSVVKIGTRHQESELKILYDFTVERVLRATENGTKALTSRRLLTAGNSAMCGVFLEEGKEYVITGSVDTDGNPRVNLCNYHGLWSDVSEDVKKGFLGGYKCSNK